MNGYEDVSNVTPADKDQIRRRGISRDFFLKLKQLAAQSANQLEESFSRYNHFKRLVGWLLTALEIKRQAIGSNPMSSLEKHYTAWNLLEMAKLQNQTYEEMYSSWKNTAYINY